MDPEVLRDLLQRRLRIPVPRDPDNILAELLGERLGHSDILSARSFDQTNQLSPIRAADPFGSLRMYADLGKAGWNDIVVDGRGNAYINAAGFDVMAGEEFTPGFVTLVTADGSVRQVADDVAFPNGMAVTADNSTLIVADSYRHHLVAFDIGADGGLSNRRVWADLGEGTPDGICVDAQGAVWYADVPNHGCTRVAEGGTVLRTVTLDRGGFACALGGPDGTTLFIAAAEWRGMAEQGLVAPGSGQVLTTQVEVPGAGWP